MKDFFRFIWRAWKYRLRSNRAEIEKILATVKKGQNCIDIGAHKGAYTYWFSRAVGLTGHVDAFEPQPGLAELLNKLIDDADICNTEVHQLALSNASGKAKLNVPVQRGGTPGATLERPNSTLQTQSIEVQTTTIDEFYDGRFSRPISFIKCDAEGHELEIFNGGRKTIEEDTPVLLFECEVRHHSREKMFRTFEFLHSINYAGFFFHKSELHPLADFDPDIYQAPDMKHSANNFLFYPRKQR
jgi:FkbM family methyltransferase